MPNLMLSPQRSTLTKSEIIAAYLQQMALPSLWHRILSESDYELWDTVLDPYSIPAIRYAFDTWLSGAKRFPAPSDILPLCGSYAEQQALGQHRKVKAKSQGLLNPDLAFLLAPEIVARAQLYHRRGVNPAPPLEESEIAGLIALAKTRFEGTASNVKRFPNGNPIYNRALVQARALVNAGR